MEPKKERKREVDEEAFVDRLCVTLSVLSIREIGGGGRRKERNGTRESKREK